MNIAWMLYGLLAAALFGVAALAIEQLTRLMRGPTRWVWSTAIAGTIGLMAVVPWRMSHEYWVDAEPAYSVVLQPEAVPPRRPPVEFLQVALQEEPWSQNRLFMPYVSRLMAPHSGALELFAACAWLTSSLGMFTLLVVVARRYATARDGWPVADIDGVTVHVTPDAGPAVLGFVRPWIAVPAWLMERPAHEQQMVVDHEVEHLLARDHTLLAAGWVAIALMPWNVVVWWMVMRLRMAVEIDCDRRMLRRGVPAHSYGLLLIDVASQYRGLGLGSTAFASRPSQLERRLRAMKGTSRRFARARGVAFSLLAVGAVLLAAWAPIPQSGSSASFEYVEAAVEVGPVSSTVFTRGTAVSLPRRGWVSYVDPGHEWVEGAPVTIHIPPIDAQRVSLRQGRLIESGEVHAQLNPVAKYTVMLLYGGAQARLDCSGRGDDQLVCVNPICFTLDATNKACADPSAPLVMSPSTARGSGRDRGTPMVDAARLSDGTVTIESVRLGSSSKPGTWVHDGDDQRLLDGAYRFTKGRMLTGDSAVAFSGNASARRGVLWLTLAR